MGHEKSHLTDVFDQNSAIKDGGKTYCHALMIDIQLGCLTYMDIDDAEAYLDKIADTLIDLRQRNVPITWVTIGEQDRLNDAVSNQARIRQQSDFIETDFLSRGSDPLPETESETQMRLLFENFLSDHGPRENEAILQKTSFGAFNNPDNIDGSFADYLREHHNAGQVLITGMMSAFCPLETALEGAQEGFDVAICSDAVVSWLDTDYTTAIWNHNSDFHEQKMQDRIDKIIADPDRPEVATDKVRIDVYENIAADIISPMIEAQDVTGISQKQTR